VLEVVVNRDDVRVAERSCEPRLAQEPFSVSRVESLEGAELFERNLTVEVDLARDIHCRHAAASDLAADLVAADDSSGRHHLKLGVGRQRRRTARRSSDTWSVSSPI
jgi:hypothetical protein